MINQGQKLGAREGYPNQWNIVYLLLFHFLFFLATISPILANSLPLLADLPNHLARWHILANRNSIPELQQNYEIISHFSPYQLIDWFLAPLVGLFDVYIVGKIFVVFTMVVVYAGVIALHTAVSGRLSIWPAMVLPLLYNHAFFWGFLNFNFAVGLLFWALAIWIWLGHTRYWPRIIALFGMATIIYFCHMLAFGLFAIVISSHGFMTAIQQHGWKFRAVLRDLAPVVTPFLLGLAVYIYWQSGVELEGEKITRYGGAYEKAVTLMSPTLFLGHRLEYILFTAFIFTGVYFKIAGKMRPAWDMSLSLVFFLAIVLVMPNIFLGVWGVDFRLPAVFLMFLVATMKSYKVFQGPSRVALILVITALVTVRVASLWSPLDLASQNIEEFRKAVTGIPKGSRVLVSLDPSAQTLPLPATSYWHLAQIAVIERHAFVPFLFTGVTQIRAAGRNRDLDTASGHPLLTIQLNQGLSPEFIANHKNRVLDIYHRIYWADWPKYFDYLVRINPVEPSARMAATFGSIAKYSYFEIVELKKQE